MDDGDATFSVGMNLYKQASRQEALPYFLLSASEYHEAGNAEGECQALVMAGESLRMLNRVDEAGDLLTKAADIAEKTLSVSDANTRVYAFLTYGNFLTNVGKFEEALRYHRLAVDQAQQVDSAEVKSNAYLFLGQTFLRAHEWSSARRPITLASYYARRVPNAHTQCNAFLQYGELLVRSRKGKRAERWLEKAARLSLKQPDLQLRCNCCRAFGSISHDAKWLKKAAEIAIDLEDAHTACNAFVAYAEVLSKPEALKWLRRAGAKLSKVHDPHTRLMVQDALIDTLFHRGQWLQVLTRSVEAVSDLLAAMRHNPFVDGVAAIAEQFPHVVPFGVYAADQLQRTRPELNAMATVLPLLDAVKSVQIREGLRRHIEGMEVHSRPMDWKAGPPTWGDAFSTGWSSVIEAFSEKATARGASAVPPGLLTIRGSRAVWGEVPMQNNTPVLELPAQPNSRKNEFCEPTRFQDSADLLPDEQTLVLYFSIVGQDIVVLPIHRHSSNIAIVEGGREGIIWVRDALPVLEELVLQQDKLIEDAKAEMGRSIHRNEYSIVRLRERCALHILYQRAFEVIDGRGLMNLLTQRMGSLENLHLVVIPDGPLYELPVHAFVVDGNSKRLYQCFQSFRYGLSLKTLSLQAIVQQATKSWDNQSGSPRVCIFANPDKDGLNPLPGVVKEAGVLVKLLEGLLGAECRVHGDTDRDEFRATRQNFEEWHRRANFLWVCGHGQPTEDVVGGNRVSELAFRLCDGSTVGPSRFLHDDYDLRAVDLFVASACLLGRMHGSKSGAGVRDFNAALALRGCRRVTSALWELLDWASPVFAKEYMTAIVKNALADHSDSHAYSKAYTEALGKFRQYNQGSFDHEFFWAPYTFYGLG